MNKLVTSIFLGVLLVAGCSSVQTLVEQNPNVDFDTYQTWDWYPRDAAVTGDQRVDLAEDFQKFIMTTVEEHLAGRGYKRSGFSPDLYVDYQVTLQDFNQSQVINNYYGEDSYPDMQFNLPSFQTTYKYEWEEGALLLMMFDAKSKQLVWRGIASTEVNTQGPRKEARERIDKAVEKLTDDVPKT